MRRFRFAVPASTPTAGLLQPRFQQLAAAAAAARPAASGSRSAPICFRQIRGLQLSAPRSEAEEKTTFGTDRLAAVPSHVCREHGVMGHMHDYGADLLVLMSSAGDQGATGEILVSKKGLAQEHPHSHHKSDRAWCSAGEGHHGEGHGGLRHRHRQGRGDAVGPQPQYSAANVWRGKLDWCPTTILRFYDSTILELDWCPWCQCCCRFPCLETAGCLSTGSRSTPGRQYTPPRASSAS